MIQVKASHDRANKTYSIPSAKRPCTQYLNNNLIITESIAFCDMDILVLESALQTCWRVLNNMQGPSTLRT